MHAKKLKHHDTRHHRRCRSNGGSNNESNISVVPKNKHEAFHLLFNNMEAPEIAATLNRIWIDPAWELYARRTDYDD